MLRSTTSVCCAAALQGRRACINGVASWDLVALCAGFHIRQCVRQCEELLLRSGKLSGDERPSPGRRSSAVCPSSHLRASAKPVPPTGVRAYVWEQPPSVPGSHYSGSELDPTEYDQQLSDVPHAERPLSVRMAMVAVL
eukprot:scaffold222888_cov28-Tisochrysis_lutea.AAC.1